MEFRIDSVLKTISENEWTILAVSRGGEIREIIPLHSIPDLEVVEAIGKRNKGCAFRGIPRSNVTESKLREIIQDLVDTIEYAKTHKLKAGINIPK